MGSTTPIRSALSLGSILVVLGLVGCDPETAAFDGDQLLAERGGRGGGHGNGHGHAYGHDRGHGHDGHHGNHHGHDCGDDEDSDEPDDGGDPGDGGGDPDPTPAQPADLGGYVWLDFDGDGALGTSPLYMQSIPVFLFEDADLDGFPDGAAVDSVLTDSSGAYLFEQLLGDYVVVAEDPDGLLCGLQGPDSMVDPTTGYSTSVSVADDDVLDFDLAVYFCPL